MGSQPGAFAGHRQDDLHQSPSFVEFCIASPYFTSFYSIHPHHCSSIKCLQVCVSGPFMLLTVSCEACGVPLQQVKYGAPEQLRTPALTAEKSGCTPSNRKHY
jgi:hypothetical protein